MMDSERLTGVFFIYLNQILLALLFLLSPQEDQYA